MRYRKRRHDDVHWPFGGARGHRVFGGLSKKRKAKVVQELPMYLTISPDGQVCKLGRYSSLDEAKKFARMFGDHGEVVLEAPQGGGAESRKGDSNG